MSKRGPTLRGIELTKSFGSGGARTVALHKLSLDLYGGDFALVMGPSGCGKSTLLAVLSGLLQPDSGQVVVLEEDLWRKSERARRDFRLRHFGFIFQAHNLLPTLTAREQLEMVARWSEGLAAPEAYRRVGEMLDLLDLTHKGDRMPQELSGGEKQRVAIGRALLKNPRFCFADEPTSALDWEHGRQVIEFLHQATRRHGATVLVVGHDARIATYADRTFHLDDGRLVEPDENSGGSP